MSSKYTAIIVEPRQHKALSFVLNNFLENLSDEWNIIIIHGTNNYDYLLNIIETNLNIYKDRIKLINLHVANLTINDYNKLLKSHKFYEYIPTEVFMIFQTDSMIIPKYREYINFFLNFDYVGAPWNNGLVGNGGLSIRKKSKMLEIINAHNTFDQNNEDGFFSLNKSIPLFKPTFTQATLFSMEQVFSKNGSFGIHKAWDYIDNKLLKDMHDDIITLKNLQ